MRYLIHLLLLGRLMALDNAYRVTDRTGSTQTNRPFTISWTFVKDEICDYPQPFTGGSGITPWQSDNINRWPASSVCPSGSVKRADISFRATVPANSTLTVDFRNNTNPCSSGNRAACDSAALDQAGMLAFSSWDGTLTATANPAGSTTTRTFSARTAMSAGDWSYRLRGPVVTLARVENLSTSRTRDFGWKSYGVVRLTALIGTTDTAIPVETTADFSGLSRPFTVEVGGEHIQICYVAGTTLTVGTTNGGSTACATSAGRGADGTTATFHSTGTHGDFVRLGTGTWITSDLAMGENPTTTFTVNSSSISAVTYYQIGSEVVRVCNRSGTTLTVGTGSWGCTANAAGRNYYGSNVALGNSGYYWPAGIMIREFSSAAWIDAPEDKYKSLHPAAQVIFYTGWSGVGIAFELENAWADRMQDQIFDVSLSTSAGSVKSLTQLKQIARTRYRWPLWADADSYYWDGTAPGALRLNLNARYKRASGLLPIDPEIKLAQSGVDAELTAANIVDGTNTREYGWDHASNNRCEDTIANLDATGKLSFGSHVKGIDVSGARRGIGIINGYTARQVASWESTATNAYRMDEVAIAMGRCTGLIPLHYREGATGLLYCNAGAYTANTSDKSCTGGNLSASAFGRWISVNARPTIVPGNQASTQTADKLLPVGYMTNNYFGYENGTVSQWIGHIPQMAYWGYMFTGDPFLQQEALAQGHAAAAGNAEYTDYFSTNLMNERSRMRHRDLGILIQVNGTRGMAWGWRDVGMGALVADDGSPEQQYLSHIIDINTGVREGFYELTDGAFYVPCSNPAAPNDYSPWCIGRYKAGNVSWTATYPIEVPGQYMNTSSSSDSQKTFSEGSPWMDAYYMWSLNYLESMGFSKIRALRRTLAKGRIDRITHPAYNPYLVAQYREPAMPCLPEGTPQVSGCAAQVPTPGTAMAFTSYAAMKDGFLAANQAETRFVPNQLLGPNDLNTLGGYSQIAFSATAQIVDFRGTYSSGERAYQWLKQNIRAQDYSDLPMIAITPDPTPVVSITAGDTALLFRIAQRNSACTGTVSTSPFASWDDSGDTALASGRIFTAAFAGLTADTDYYWRITCGNGRVSGKTRTATAKGGTTSVTVKTKLPAWASAVRIDYGSDDSLGSSVSSTCSAGICSATVPGNLGRRLCYQFAILDGSSNVLQRSGIHRRIP